MATILVVDDEFGIVQVLRDVLSEYDYDVVTALNGRQALERLAEQSIDLVLTDYMMPALDGPALVRAMRVHEKYQTIPVVIMSSLPAEQLSEAVPRLSGFVRKPFRIQTVLDASQALLPGPRAAAE